jgi:SlyX protein
MSATNADERLTNVELLLTHLQHDLEQLSQVVFRQQSELDALRKELALLDSRVVTLAEGPELRDPLAEKPPHY